VEKYGVLITLICQRYIKRRACGKEKWWMCLLWMVPSCASMIPALLYLLAKIYHN